MNEVVLGRSLAVLALLLSHSAVVTAQGQEPPRSSSSAVSSDGQESRYIVVFRKDAKDASAAGVMAGHAGVVRGSYSRALRGFAADLPQAAVAQLARHPQVAYIERDQTFKSTLAQSPQSSPTWNLDRVDQRSQPLDGQFAFQQSGAGVYAFIVDTGIRPDHVEFTGRVAPGASFVMREPPVDFNGHGTHTAGVVAGSTYGVAKDATLVQVKVLNRFGSGQTTDILAGLEWIATQTQYRPGVANMSLGGPYSAALNEAVAGVVAAGVPVVVAAGNDSGDACSRSPASAPAAIVVAATDQADGKAWFSNHGPCVGLFAPGVDVLSSYSVSQPDGVQYPDGQALAMLSGTSEAAPHVAGKAVALLEAFPKATPAWIKAHVLRSATQGRVTGLDSATPNLLLYTDQTVYGASVRAMSSVQLSTKSTWGAQVTVSVYDASLGTPVEGALVRATFAPGGITSCTTAISGACPLAVAQLPRKQSLTTLTVNDITGWNLAYRPNYNAATSLTVLKPEF